MPSDDEVRDAMIQLLGATVLDRDTVAAALAQRGLVPADDHTAIDRAVQRDPRFSQVSDGLIFVPAVLDTTVWTVWVDAADAAEGYVRIHPHLSPLGWWLVADDVELRDAENDVLGVLETDGIWLDGRDTDVVIGPPGWLDGFAGGWASVEVAGRALRWTSCDTPPEPSARQAAALRSGFARAARRERSESLVDEPIDLRFASGDGPMFEALVADRAAFAGEPIAPLPDLQQAAALEARGGILAEHGFDWDALRSWQQTNRLCLNYGLTSEQAELVKLALGALLAHADDAEHGLGADEHERDGAAALFALLLDDGAVASALWNESLRRDVPLDAVAAFANALEARLENATPVGLRWLRARCLDWSGDARAAVALLDDVVAGSCSHRPALLDAAGFASDRGDEQRAYRLARRAELLDAAGDDDDQVAALLDEVEPYARRPTARLVGRNDPCPCGSGRKYKACHLGREDVSLADRSPWLYAKATRFLQTRRPDTVHALADALADHAESPALYDQLVEAPFVVDLALHEDGGFADFLAARDGVLPADEALLAAQWSLVERGLFEISSIDGPALELYDLGRAEQLTVVNTHPSTHTRVGTVMLGRPLPVGDSYRAFSGFIAVPPTALARTLEVIDRHDLDELTACVGEWFRAPRLSNTDGDDLELHTIRWRVPEPRAVDAALRAAGFERDDARPVWRSIRTEPGGSNTVIATLELFVDELVAEVNSRRRADDLRDVVAAAIPGSVLLGDAATSIDDALAEHEPTEPLTEDPAARAALAELIVDYERRWLDEAIPALGGRTPRDAVADPIGREEVRRLLDSFPEPDPGREGMNPRRLRSALGL